MKKKETYIIWTIAPQPLIQFLPTALNNDCEIVSNNSSDSYKIMALELILLSLLLILLLLSTDSLHLIQFLILARFVKERLLIYWKRLISTLWENTNQKTYQIRLPQWLTCSIQTRSSCTTNYKITRDRQATY